ncbi:MAG: hypothetical protein ABR607_16165 [Pyrinomonadaceae bacterium]
MKSIDSQPSQRDVGLHEIRNEYLSGSDEEELCAYLVQKYESQLPLNDDAKYEFQRDYRLLADTIRQNIVKRKANVFSRPQNTRRIGITTGLA